MIKTVYKISKIALSSKKPLKVILNKELREFMRKDKWRIDKQDAKSKKLKSYDNLCKDHEHGGLPCELMSCSAESEFMRGFEIKKLHDCINNLSPTKRRRLKLHFFEGLTLKQISHIEKVSIVSVHEDIKKSLLYIKKMSNDLCTFTT